MKKIVLISCVSQKRNTRSKARDLYTSPLFRLNLSYAESLAPDTIFVLSAKHGLLELDQEIEPYNLTLNAMKGAEVRIWAERVLADLAQRADLERDRFIFLAGARYRKYLLPFLENSEVPMAGLTIGRQLQWLKGLLDP
jgi:hypothetical protein